MRNKGKTRGSLVAQIDRSGLHRRLIGFDHAGIEAVVTAAPDCAAAVPASPAADFDLPFKGTRVIVATPNADVCWRRQVAGGQWGEWNRAFTGSGQFIDTQL